MKLSARRQARQYALQAIYAWQISQNDISIVKVQFLHENDMQHVDIDYFCDLLEGVAARSSQLDELMQPYLSRTLNEIDLVAKAILRLALHELTQRRDVPYKVVLNEAIELSKCFGSRESHKFINGVLDKIVSKHC